MQQPIHAELLAAVERRMEPADRRRYARECERDYTLAPWIRLVTHIDTTKRGGFCFIGRWIRRGFTPTKTLTLPAIALVALERLDPQDQQAYRTYHITVIHSNGYITLTDISTDNLSPGWAFRMLPAVSYLLRTLPEYDTTRHPKLDAAWPPSRIILKPLAPSPGWYR